MKIKLLILSILISTVSVFAGGSPSVIDCQTERSAVVPDFSSVPTTAIATPSQDSTNAESQAPLFSKEKLRQLRKEIKEVRQLQKRHVADSTGSDKPDPMAMASFFSGLGAYGVCIMALVFPPFILLAPVLAVLGVVFGFVGLGNIRKNKTSGSGFAIAGIVLGGIFLLLMLLVFLLLVSLFATV